MIKHKELLTELKNTTTLCNALVQAVDDMDYFLEFIKPAIVELNVRLKMLTSHVEAPKVGPAKKEVMKLATLLNIKGERI